MSNPRFSLLEREVSPKILLLGDVMLDRYLFGTVERISPEAPIPILRIERQEHRLGGAGSVATMTATLGATVFLAAVVGNDVEGVQIRNLLQKNGIDTSAVLTVTDRPTTVKERLLGRTQQRYPHQMVRVDREIDTAIQPEIREKLLQKIAEIIGSVDLVLISDYNKGVCKDDMIRRVITLAHSVGVPVLADPVKGADYHRYTGCYCITPNRVEAAMATGMTIHTPEDGITAAQKLLDFGVHSAIVTLDRDGMALAERSGKTGLFPARAREVCDITGAGDMVLSTLGYVMALGGSLDVAIEIANAAGGLEVERLGVVPLTRQEILAELGGIAYTSNNKIIPIERLEEHLSRIRQSHKRLVMTNGCFDLLHPGHVASLQEARRQGDCLLVGLNSDRSVRELKGPGRPIVDQHGRATMLAALDCVDYVVIFDDVSVANLVERVAPDVLVKGGQYAIEDIVGHEVVLRNGGRVVPLPMKEHYSTTALVEKIIELYLHSTQSSQNRAAA